MSTFPSRPDNLPFLTEDNGDNPAGSDFGATQAPAELISRMNSAARAIEGHIAFSILSGGDTRADGTVVAPAPERRWVALSGTWTITDTQAGKYSFYANLGDVLGESQILLVNNTAAPDLASVPTPASPLVLAQNAAFVFVRRRGSHQWITASLVSSARNQALAAVSFTNSTKPLQTSETLDILLLFYGGA